MTTKLLFKELELLLSDIAFAGIHNLQPVSLQKLEELKHEMVELNMTEGVHLIDRFITTIHAFKEDKSPVSDAVSTLCVLEFYQKTISENI